MLLLGPEDLSSTPAGSSKCVLLLGSEGLWSRWVQKSCAPAGS